MKNLRLILSLALAVSGSVLAPRAVSAPAPESTSAADAAWAELQASGLLGFRMPPNYPKLSRREQSEWRESQALRLREKGGAFIAAHPTDPRRWTLVWRMINVVPEFIQSYGPNYQNDTTDVVKDTAAAAAWHAQLSAWEAELRAAPDLPPDVREAVDPDTSRLNRLIGEAGETDRQGRPVDWTAVTQAVLAYAAKYPENTQLAPALRNLMWHYEGRHSPAESLAAWRPLVVAANVPLADMAREKVRALSAITGELDLRFTAVDGREVDLQKLRGKVVLIDFWATWCVPCMAEMPNVKRIYAAYHDKGFEIIGVSCDIAPAPSDTPQKARLAKTAAQLIEFKEKNGMPWPDYYDGNKHNEGGNQLAKRFAITGIPASFLVDQTGQVVALNLKGEKLEAAVKRLLRLQN